MYREIGVFEETQAKQVEDYASAENKALFILGPVQDVSPYPVGNGHAEYKKDENWHPAHIKTIAGEKKHGQAELSG